MQAIQRIYSKDEETAVEVLEEFIRNNERSDFLVSSDFIPTLVSDNHSGLIANTIAESSDPKLFVQYFDKFRSWLKSDDFQTRTNALICIGNIVCSDEVACSLISNDLIEEIRSLCASEHIKEQHAALSTLKNFAIPKENKSELASESMIRTIENCMTRSPAVSLQAIGLLRLICAEHEHTKKLSTSFVHSIAEIFHSSEHEGLKSESARVLALCVKGNSKFVLDSLVPSQLYLINSEHEMLRMEGLLSMFIFASNDVIIDSFLPLVSSLLRRENSEAVISNLVSVLLLLSQRNRLNFSSDQVEEILYLLSSFKDEKIEILLDVLRPLN